MLRRCRAGDETALDALYVAYGGRARRIALRALGDRDLADDAVQEAFLQLWRQADRFDPRRASLSTWICVLAHRRAVDIARREARRRFDEGHERGAADTYTAEELVVLREEGRRVRAAVGELSTPLRQVVELAYWGDLTQREVAERLSIPLGTVKSRMFEALGRLNVALQPG